MFGTAFLFRSRRSAVIAAVLAAVLAASAGTVAAQTTPQAVPGAGEPAAGATPAAPAGTPPSATNPTPASPQAGAPQTGAPDEDQSASDAQTVELAAQPVAILAGKSDWDDGFQTLQDDFAKIRTEMTKAGLTPAGRPFAVFLQTDDQSFTFNAMIPVTGVQQGQTALANGVTLGTSPAGKTIKFQHEGAYDDIDATYEAINAYLDEKGLEAQDLFIEQYLNDANGSDDPNLDVDIYVFLKP
ncbi:MAG TPA: GyrI-like domain-containing protein [Beijerinckiaceae bacterium]|jgi:effector-binding domain-containing protein|nr:GyrI-like domain-containing protein [Beijerinckiaceae bacterium]